MKVNGVDFMVGADPEFFVKKDGIVQSAFGLIQGTKFNPFKVNKGAVQVDGMALEYNIDPASSPEEFYENLTSVRDQLLNMIPGYEVEDKSSVVFDEEVFNKQPLEATLLGCEPDFNGWSMDVSNPPDASGRMRTAGGHVHVGGFHCNDPSNHSHFQTCGRLARIMDETLGIYSLLWDYDDKRRSMYGKAGCFRPKTYGMEYRTLSNKWIFQGRLTQFVFSAVEESLKKMFDPNYQPNPEVEHIINESDRSHPLLKTPRADEVRAIVES